MQQMQQMQQDMSLNQVPISQQMMLGNQQDQMNEMLINQMKPIYGNNLLSVEQYANALRQQGETYMQPNQMNMHPTQMTISKNQMPMTMQQNQMNLFKNIAQQSNNSSILV